MSPRLQVLACGVVNRFFPVCIRSCRGYTCTECTLRNNHNNHHNHHNHHKGLNQVARTRVIFLFVPLAVDMSLHVDGACGAAMRRRQRRLRAQLRHEQQTVTMVLATVGHHSFGPTAYDALRSQKPVTSTREGGGGRGERRATATEASTPGDAAGTSWCGTRAAGLLARGSSAAGLWSTVVVHAGFGGHDGRRSRRWCPRLPHAGCPRGPEGGGEEGAAGAGEGEEREQRCAQAGDG